KGRRHPMFGKKHTEEARRKMSQAATGRVLTAEQKRKIGEASRLRAMKEENIRKLRDYNRTKVVSEETRKKISLAVKRQWESPEGRQKFLDSRKQAIAETRRSSCEMEQEASTRATTRLFGKVRRQYADLIKECVRPSVFWQVY